MAWHLQQRPRPVATTHGKLSRLILLAGSCAVLCFAGLWALSARGEEPAAADEAELATAPRSADAKEANGGQANDDQAVAAGENVLIFAGEMHIQNGAVLAVNLNPFFGLGGGIDYVEQFRPFLNFELAFVRQICANTTIDQRRKIKIAGELALRAAAKKMAENQPVENAGDDATGADPVADAVALIRDGLAKAVRETLPTDQAERFAAESAQRVARRKRASILLFVAKLDRLVYLTPEQRETVVASLSAGWQAKWESWYRVLADDQLSLPPVPDALLECLNGEQWAVWKSAPTTEFGMDGFGVNSPDEDDSAWWGGNLGAVVTILFEILETSWQAFARPW